MNYLHFVECGIGSHAALQRIVGILLIIGLIVTGCELSTAIAEASDKNKAGIAIVVARDKGIAGGAKIVTQEYADVIGIAALSISEAIRSSTSFQKAIEAIRNPSVFSSTFGHLSRFRNNLDWSNPDINHTKFMRAGMREGYRDLAAAQRVWETIPRQIRASGPEATVRYLKDRDWSHIRAYSKGGSNAASNGIFESASLNRTRGNARMTTQEIRAAQSVLQTHAFHATLLESAKNAMKGAVTAAAIIAVVVVLEYGLQYQKGEITEDEMYLSIGKAIIMAGISGAAVSALITAMALTFPAIMPVLTAISVPLMVIGFSVMGAKLVTLGKGWYEVYVSEQPLKPIAFRYWITKRYESMKDKAVGIVSTTVSDIRELTPTRWQARPALHFR